jgi:hypothetical protein
VCTIVSCKNMHHLLHSGPRHCDPGLLSNSCFVHKRAMLPQSFEHSNAANAPSRPQGGDKRPKPRWTCCCQRIIASSGGGSGARAPGLQGCMASGGHNQLADMSVCQSYECCAEPWIKSCLACPLSIMARSGGRGAVSRAELRGRPRDAPGPGPPRTPLPHRRRRHGDGWRW